MRLILILFILSVCMDIYGQTTDELNQQAIELSKNGDIKKAIGKVEKSLKADPNKKETYFAYGGILLLKNDIKGAEEKFIKAIRLDSNYADPYDYLSIIYFQTKDLQKGLKCLDKSISIEPTVTRLLGRADIKGMLRDYDGAVRDCDEIIKIDPLNPNAYLTRGNCKFGLRDKVGACADLRRAIELGIPKDAFFIKYCEN